MKLLILTGQRCGEVAGMTWREIDLIGKTWNIPKERTKNGIAHSVPADKKVIFTARIQGIRSRRVPRGSATLPTRNAGMR